MHNKKTINVPRTPQRGIRGVHVGFPLNQAGYLVFVPATHQLVTFNDINFDEQFITAVTYMAKPFQDALAMQMLGQFNDPYCEQEQTGDTKSFKEGSGEASDETRDDKDDKNNAFQLLLESNNHDNKQDNKHDKKAP